MRNEFDHSSLCIKPVKGMGYGLFCNDVSFKRGDAITEYVGKVIDQHHHNKILEKK